MTKDDILNMPAGRETDALIWMALNNQKPDLSFCRSVDGEYQPHAGYPSGHISPPNYSTDISAAWEVVEKINGMIGETLHEDYNYLTLEALGGSGGYAASFDSIFDDDEWYEDISLYKYAAKGINAPLAICRAALLAVMDNKDV